MLFWSDYLLRVIVLIFTLAGYMLAAVDGKDYDCSLAKERLGPEQFPIGLLPQIATFMVTMVYNLYNLTTIKNTAGSAYVFHEIPS